jgi:hypothetical protein
MTDSADLGVLQMFLTTSRPVLSLAASKIR